MNQIDLGVRTLPLADVRELPLQAGESPRRVHLRIRCRTCNGDLGSEVPVEFEWVDGDRYAQAEMGYAARIALPCPRCATELRLELAFRMTRRWIGGEGTLTYDGVCRAQGVDLVE